MRSIEDMKEIGTGIIKVDIGYGHIENVNVKVADYIYRLRSIIKNAGLSENPRHNVGKNNETSK